MGARKQVWKKKSATVPGTYEGTVTLTFGKDVQVSLPQEPDSVEWLDRQKLAGQKLERERARNYLRLWNAQKSDLRYANERIAALDKFVAEKNRQIEELGDQRNRVEQENRKLEQKLVELPVAMVRAVAALSR